MREPSDLPRDALARQAATEHHDRHRVADRLHDGPQQILVSLRVRLQLLQRQLPEHLAGEVDVLIGQLDAARRELRSLAVDLEAPAAGTPLVEAVRWLLQTNAAAAGWQTSLTVESAPDVVDDAVRLTAVRIVQEALAAVRIHSAAGQVDVAIREADGWLELAVTEDGGGSEGTPDDPADSRMRTMRERADILGGAVRVEAGRPGTRVTIRLPVRPTPSPGIASIPDGDGR